MPIKIRTHVGAVRNNDGTYKGFDGFSPDMREIKDNIEEIASDLSELNQDVLKGAVDLSRGKEIPVYSDNASTDRLNSNEIAAFRKVVTHNLTSRYMNLIFITDTHANREDTQAMMESLQRMNRTGMFDLVIHGGDIITTEDDNEEPYEINRIIEEGAAYKYLFNGIPNLLYCWGNHDNGHDSTGTMILKWNQMALMYRNSATGLVGNSGDRDGGYFYYDNSDCKIRLITLRVFGTKGTLTFGSTQNGWLTNTLTNTPTGYKVVIFCHYMDNSTQLNNIRTAINTFMTSRPGDFIGVIHGHKHIDQFDTDLGFNNIGVLKGSRGYSMFTFDTTSRKIYETRIGDGVDRQFSY